MSSQRQTLLFLLLIALITLLLVGCGANQAADVTEQTTNVVEEATDIAGEVETAAEEVAPAEDGQIVFAASLPASDNPWWISVRKTLENLAEQHNIALEVAIANEDPSKQLTDVEDLIQKQPDALIIGPVDMVASVAAVERAVEAGIPVFAVGRETESDKIIASVTAPEEDLGRAAAEYVCNMLTERGGGQVLHLRGAAGASYTNRQEEGFNEVMADCPAAEIVSQAASRDNRAEGLRLTEDALQRWPELDAVVGANDELALGALGAIEAAGLPLYPNDSDGIIVTGNTGNPDGIAAIQEGRMAYLGMKGPFLFATSVFNMTHDYVVEGVRDIPQYQFTELVRVTLENVDDPGVREIWEQQ